jgi:hypothetical protein
MAQKLRIVITFGTGPPRTFERSVEAPVDDAAAAVSMGMIAFDEAFNLELEWIRQRSEEEARAFCEEHAA